MSLLGELLPLGSAYEWLGEDHFKNDRKLRTLNLINNEDIAEFIGARYWSINAVMSRV